MENRFNTEWQTTKKHYQIQYIAISKIMYNNTKKKVKKEEIFGLVSFLHTDTHTHTFPYTQK